MKTVTMYKADDDSVHDNEKDAKIQDAKVSLDQRLDSIIKTSDLTGEHALIINRFLIENHNPIGNAYFDFQQTCQNARVETAIA